MAVTTNKEITKPAYNEYATLATGWSGPINLNWDTIDAGFGGVSTLTAVSGTSTLTVDQYRNLTLQSSAALTDNVTYRIPSGVGGQWIVKNATTVDASKTTTSTGASGTGTIATLTHSAAVTFAIGSTIVVTGMTPTAYNGTYTVTNSSAGSVSFASTATGAQTVAGTITNSFLMIISNVAGGTSVSIPRDQTATVFSDGTNIALADNPTPTINSILATRDVNAGTGLTGGGPLSGDVTITADQATDVNWRQNTANKLLNPNAVWTSMAEEPLADGATISWDMQTGFDFIVIPSTARTLANPTNTKVGQKGRLIVQQPPSGGPGTLTWGSNFKFANGVAPTLSTTADAIDVLYYDVRSSTYIIISLAGRAFA